MEEGTTPQYLTYGGRASPTAKDGVSQWMGSVALAQCSYSSQEFGVCTALAVAKVCSSLPKALLPPFHPRLAAPNREQHTEASPQLYFASRAAAHGKENADLRKIPGALLLRPVFPILFLILEAGGVAGVARTGPVPVLISMEAAHRLARSLQGWERRGDPGSPRSTGFNYPYPYLHSCSYGSY